MATVREALEAAQRYYQAGQLGQAEQLCRGLLRAEPAQFDAVQLLGILLHQQGRHEDAVTPLRQALRLHPDSARVHLYLSSALTALGRTREALDSCRELVRLCPDRPEAHTNLGNGLLALGRPEEALASYREALRLRPDYPEAHNNLGAALKALGRPVEALASYREALRLRPGYTDARNNVAAGLLDVGTTEQALGRVEEALACYREALRLRPDLPEAHNNVATALETRGRPEEALASYREALRLRPDYPEAHYNLGSSLKALGRVEEAVACYREALRLRPDYPEAHNNLGMALEASGKLEEALSCYEEASRLRPDLAEAHNNRGLVLMALGRQEEALASCRAAVRFGPDYADGHFSLANALLRMGDMEPGWREYEWRWRLPRHPKPAIDGPRWDGGPLEGRTILLWAEQGLGDTLQFVRFAPLVQRRGGTVLLACQPRLTRLLRGVPGVDGLLPLGGPLPPFEMQASLMSLPRLLGTTLETIPAEVPYFSPEPELLRRWAEELGPAGGLRVGIAWQGRAAQGGERSIPLREFAPLAQVEGVRLFSLQFGFGTEQLAEATRLFPITDLGSRLDTGPDAFVDTAAVMRHLDLVVSCDTAVPHLAGALGVPVWVGLLYNAEWRWLLGRQDTPWYPTMRLFRQRRRGDWASVFEDVAAAARDLPQGRVTR